jgi:formamidopyrimidine-DNA glycosylase
VLEIPESYTISRQLNQTINGKKIQSVYANATPHGFAFYFGDPNQYQVLLRGKTVGIAKAIAGQIEITVENVKILFNDGINIRYFKPGEQTPIKHQLYIEFEDASSIVCTVQMYGGLSVFIDGENTNPYYIVAKEKPSPLSDQFNRDYFMDMFGNTKQTISTKALLATEQRIPGLGNGALQDILFNARINPKRKINTLSDQEIEGLYQSVKKTISDMTEQGGRDTEKDLLGNICGYKTILSNKTLKEPCPVCGREITRQAYLGGNIYYCSNCQPI